MAKSTPTPSWQRALIVLTATVVTVVVIVCLYWAQTILIPVALAVYLTFLLAPLVGTLQRIRLGRIPAALLVVALMALLLGGTGWIVARQVTGLVKELPTYTDNIKAKIESLRATGEGSSWEGIERMVKDLSGNPKSKPAGSEGGSSEQPAPEAAPAGSILVPAKPAPVAVQPEGPAWLSRLPSVVSSLAESLGGLALTIVLVVFMLLKREDLRNRVIRLVGHGRLTVATKAVDDAGQRISRFLLMQVMVNGAFGLTLAVGLFLIGVEYAFLWGFLAFLLRYIPYVGTWIAAVMPIALSLAMFPGWLQPLLVIGLFLVIELVCANVVEPRLFGHSMGVSEVALLVAAAFWAFLWGPIGMVLSNPLTVCLVVLGKYIPQLEFFNVLLGDEPALDADVSYYQRLLARDQDEATQLVQAHVRKTSPEQIYDEILVPALTYAKRDRERDELTESDEQFVLRATREIVEDLSERLAAGPSGEAAQLLLNGAGITPVSKVLVLGCPAHDEADRLALEMLQQLLDPAKWQMEVRGVEMLSSQLITLAAEKNPALICLSSLPPGGLAHTRYLCKRLRARLPNAKIVVGRWGLKDNLEQNQEQLREAGADQVVVTLLEARSHFDAWLPVLSQGQPPSGSYETMQRKKSEVQALVS